MIGEKEKTVVYIGSDHAGYQAKNELKKFLMENYEVTDLGTFSEDPVDYPDIASEVGDKVRESVNVEGRKPAFGILICGTGTGMAMTANKLAGVRAAVATTEELAEMARKHNNANILAMGARTTDLELMKKITTKFLNTEFEAEERHVRRVEKIDQVTKRQ